MSNKLVILDVGGKIFKTKENNIKKSEYLNSLILSGRWNFHQNDSNICIDDVIGPIFIDEDPEEFKIVIKALRDETRVSKEYSHIYGKYGIKELKYTPEPLVTLEEFSLDQKTIEAIVFINKSYHASDDNDHDFHLKFSDLAEDACIALNSLPGYKIYIHHRLPLNMTEAYRLETEFGNGFIKCVANYLKVEKSREKSKPKKYIMMEDDS
jgi:hypothetical protein